MPRSDRSTSWVLRLWLVVGALRRRHPGPVLAGRHPAARPARRDPGEPPRPDRGHLRRARRHRRGAAYAAAPDACGPWSRPCAQRWTRRRLLLAGQRAAGLPRRLLLLPQPQELGRPQRPRGPDAARVGPVAVPRPQPGGAAARPAGSARRGVRPAGRLRVLLDAGVGLVRRGGGARPIGSATAASSSPRWCACGSSAWRRTTRSPRSGRSGRRPAEFAGLPHTMVQDTQARYLAQRAHLLAHPQAHDAFAQVSAFASLHVAVTCVILLMAATTGCGCSTCALSFFLAGTVLATDLPRLALRRRRRGGRADRRRLGGDRQTAGLSTIGRTRAPSEHAGRRRHGRPRAVDRRQLVQFVGFALRSPRGCPMVGCGSYRPAHESTQNRPSGGRRDRHGRARPGDRRISHHVDGSGGWRPRRRSSTCRRTAAGSG